MPSDDHSSSRVGVGVGVREGIDVGLGTGGVVGAGSVQALSKAAPRRKIQIRNNKKGFRINHKIFMAYLPIV
jgi:hypothetical protein